MVYNLAYHILQLFPQEDGNNRRGCFIRTKAMIIAHIRGSIAEQIRMLVHRTHHTGEDQQKLQILIGRLTRIKQIHSGVCSEGIIVVLAASVDACKGLLVEQTHQTVLVCDTLHGFHRQLVVIHSDICHSVDRRHLMLAGRNFIVLRRGCNAKLPEFLVQIGHIGSDPFTDRSEVLIIQFLSFWCRSAKKSASGINQISSFQIFLPVNQEVLLFRSDIRDYSLRILVSKQAHNPKCLLVHCFHGSQKRCFLIQCLSCIGDKGRRNTQHRSCSALFDKHGTCNIPGGISSRIMSGTQASGRKAGCIRFAHNELLAGEL